MESMSICEISDKEFLEPAVGDNAVLVAVFDAAVPQGLAMHCAVTWLDEVRVTEAQLEGDLRL